MEQNIIIPDDGISLSAVLETPEGAEGKLPLVIILHGFGSAKNRIHTMQTAETMREAGFATLRLDLFGHGESGGEFCRHTLYKWIGNTLAAINYMRGLGYTELYLSGHSQGGLVAALAGAMEPDRIPDSVALPQGVTLDGEYIRVAQTVYAEAAADRFKGPVLILQGKDDDVVPPETVRPFAARYADCELVEIEGEGHHFDHCPEEMTNRIRGFMEKLRKQPRA